MDKKNSVSLSIPQSVMVRGYEVKRLPLGKYLQAIEAIREAPEGLLRACFPGKSTAQALEALKHIDAQMLSALIMRAAGVVPREAIRLLALFTGIEEAQLMNDPDIGLDGAAELMEAFFTINQIENFLQAAKELVARIKAAIPAAGEGDGSSGLSRRG